MYTTHLGPGTVSGVTVDPDGNVYVAGTTDSSSFPTTAGAYQPSLGASARAAFVVKLAADGTVVYSTLLSGTTPRASGQQGASDAWGVAADAAGHAFVVGDTSQLDFPTTAGAAIRSTAESSSGFVTELASDGSALVYSTLLGATEPNAGTVEGQSTAKAIALDATGVAYVTGTTLSLGFPTSEGAPAPQCNPAAGVEAGFLTRISADGGSLVSSTNVVERTDSVALQPNGQAVLGGATGGLARFCTPGVVDQIDASGITLVGSWKFPACGPNGASGAVSSLAADPSGDVYVSGWQDVPSHSYVQRLGPTLVSVGTFDVPDGASSTHLALDAAGVWLAFTAGGPLYPAAGGGTSPPSSDQAGGYLVRLSSGDGAPGFATWVASTDALFVASGGENRAVVAGTESSGSFAKQAFVAAYAPVSAP